MATRYSASQAKSLVIHYT